MQTRLQERDYVEVILGFDALPKNSAQSCRRAVVERLTKGMAEVHEHFTNCDLAGLAKLLPHRGPQV